MERETALAVTEISTTHPISDVLERKMGTNGEGQDDAPVYRGKATREPIPLHPVRTLVIADRDNAL